MSEPWRLASGHLNFECDTCLMDESIRTGIHIVRTVAAIFPYLCFGKKSHSWSNTECRPDVLLKRPDECKLEQFEASWHRGRFGRKVLVFWTDDAWTVEHLNGISCRSDGCKGTEFNFLGIRTESFWRTKQSCRLWKKQLPCIKASLHKSDFFQQWKIEMTSKTK
jgi:hypothetical protein